jgi:hypothetical protein
MQTFAHCGSKEFVVALGSKGELIQRYLLGYATIQSNFRVNWLTGKSHQLSRRLGADRRLVAGPDRLAAPLTSNRVV